MPLNSFGKYLPIVKPKSGKLVSFKVSFCSSNYTRWEEERLFWSGFEEPRKLEEGPGGWGFARVFSLLAF